MANYTCEFSKIADGKYVQVPNENTAKRNTLVFADDFNHTPLRNLDKYKISYQEKSQIIDKIETVTYAREFKSDTKGVVTGEVSGEEIIFCAFKQEGDKDDDVIYIKHDDLTNARFDKPNEKYPVYTKSINGENVTFTKDETTTYTFRWL